MSTIEEMVETFTTAYRAAPWASDRSLFGAGLLAVIEKHIGPMMIQAREELFNEVTGNGVLQPFDVTPHDAYVRRILSALTAEPPRP